MSGHYKCLLAMLSLVAFVLPSPARAEPEVRKDEYALLPAFCMYTQGAPGTLADHSTYQRLVNHYGEAWKHVHHYCWGVARYLRTLSTRTDPGWKVTYARNALGDFIYVLERSPPGFFVRRDLYRKMMAIQRNQGKLEDAIATGRQMISEFPTAAEAYADTSLALVSANRLKEAAALLDVGAERAEDKEHIEQARASLLKR